MTTTTIDLRTILLSSLGQNHAARTSRLVAESGASRTEVLKALRSLQSRDAIFKAANGDADCGDWRQRSGGRYTDALWQINGEPSGEKFADLDALDRIVKTRGNLWTLLDNANYIV